MYFYIFLSLIAAARAAPQAAACRDFDLRRVSVGFECQSERKFVFKLLERTADGKEVWRDAASGTAWGDRLSVRASRSDAEASCGGKNRLPRLADAEMGEKHGFREVLPNMKEHFYWLKDGVPDARNVGYIFNGNFGKAYLITYRAIGFENIRCIVR